MIINSQKIVYSKLIDVFRILSLDQHINFINDGKVEIKINQRPLLQITPINLTSPYSNLPDMLFKRPSPEQDFFVNMDLLKKFIFLLSQKQAILRLNHIGFCYHVKSQRTEKQTLKQNVRRNNWDLYEEDSNDKSLWLFAGDACNWQDPLIEFLPMEITDFPDINWWLPHIHINIDTKLGETEIKAIANKAFGKERQAFRQVVIDNIIYQMRVWLGIISGVNIDIDLSTKAVNTKYLRQFLLEKII